MSDRIDHQAAPSEARFVVDFERGQLPFARRGWGTKGNGLQQTDHAIKKTVGIAGANFDAIGRDTQRVSFGRDVGLRDQVNGGGRALRQLETALLVERLDKPGDGIGRLRSVAAQCYCAGKREKRVVGLQFGWARKQGNGRNHEGSVDI